MNPPMTYSKKGLALTESFEGLRLQAYYDLHGILTIGYGHTGPDVTPGMVITQAQAEALLANDIQSAASCVNTAIIVSLTQPEFDALVDFVYNIGCSAFCRSTLRNLINLEQYSDAAQQFKLWDHINGKVVAGLFRRRSAEADEFNSMS